MSKNICPTGQEINTQHIFLGCSVQSFQTSIGWNNNISELSVVLYEDPCLGPRVYWDECLNYTATNTKDAGFFAENRYERVDGSLYSSKNPESVSDILIRAGVNIIGAPVYFRLQNFEYSGIVSDWVRTNSPNDAPQYRVKIVDPRLILEGVQLIIGDYAGAVNGVIPVINGGTGEPQTNLFNIYGFLEQFGVPCPSYSQCSPGVYDLTVNCTSVDGPSFGTTVGGYGGSLKNNNGIPYNYIITGFNFLANSVPALSNAFSPYGRVSFRQTGIPAGLSGNAAGLIQPDNGAGFYDNKDFYFVDLSELPAFPNNSYRIEGTSISLLDLIVRASEDLNFDFYFELLPVRDSSNQFSSNCVVKIIKLRTVSRFAQPSLDKIGDFISNTSGVLESSIGEELRNETISKFVIGGKKQTIYQALPDHNPDLQFTVPNNDTSHIASIDSLLGTMRTVSGCEAIDDTIIPYFGLDINNDLIVPCQDASGFWHFEAPTWEIQDQLQLLNFSGQTSVTIHENELRYALVGFQDWQTYSQSFESDIWLTALKPLNKGGVRVANGIDAVAKALPHDFVNPALDRFGDLNESPAQKIIEDKERIYNWVKSYAEEYYGKKFAVRVPFTCAYLDTDSLQPIISERPINNGGWTEVSNVLGLVNNGPLATGVYDYLNFFRDDENKILPFTYISGVSGVDVSELDRGTYIPISGSESGVYSLYIKSTVDEEYVFHDSSNYFGPRVVVTIPDVISQLEGDPEFVQGINPALKAVGNADVNPREEVVKGVGASDAFIGRSNRAKMISGAAIPMLHEGITYGPWFNPTTVGRVEIVNDSNLVPWRYNGYVNMNLAGVNLANESRVFMEVGELGSISFVGVPSLPLGAELNAINGGYFSGQQLVENRTMGSGVVSGTDYNGNLVSYNYARFTFPSVWAGNHGPNVTSINVNVDSNGGIRTTYNMRTFTPRRGFFERYNANRLAQLTAGQQRITKTLREESRRNALQNKVESFGQKKKRRVKDNEMERKSSTNKVFVAEEKVVGNTRRTNVANMPVSDVNREIGTNYSSKAFMSLDGVLRPVSMDGDGGFSPFIKYNNTGNNIDQDDLNPFTNPQGYNRSTVATVRSDTPSIGHDYEMLGRSGADENGMLNRATNISGNFSDDYRAMALKGPLLMKSWGYDLDGYPVPNKVDVEGAASSGIFSTSNLQSKFLDGHLQKPHTWPVAPIDLRLDRERGVWVAGSGAPQTQSQRQESMLIAITGSGLLESCCVYTGIIREESFNFQNPCDTTMSEPQEVYLWHQCPFLDIPDCVVGKEIERNGQQSSCSGMDPDASIYRFLTKSMPESTLDGGGVTGACDCCCPKNEPGSIMFARVKTCHGDTTTQTLNFSTGVIIPTCSGTNLLDDLGLHPYEGWVSENISITADVPVLLKNVVLRFPGDPIDGQDYWVRVSYSSWEHTNTYFDDGAGNWVPMGTDYTWISDGVAYTILTDENEDPITQTVTLNYKLILQCPNDINDVNANSIPTATMFMIPIMPDTYPIMGGSGAISDIQGPDNLINQKCVMNSHLFTFDSLFGNAEECTLTIDDITAGGTFSYAFFRMHWFAGCPCDTGQYPVNLTTGNVDPGVCVPPKFSVKVWWNV